MNDGKDNIQEADSSDSEQTSAGYREITSPSRVAVVLSTIGRPTLLNNLMASISAQTLPPSQVIVVDQSRDDGTRAVIDEWRDRIPVRRLTSARGASRGLNLGIAALGDYDFVGIIGDDTSYAPDTLARAVEAFADDASIGVVSGRLLGKAGKPAQLASFGARRMLLNHKTVWTSAIEATCFYRADFMRQVGPFDEELGVGAATPWQSGEGTDLLLRGLKAGWTLIYDPQIVVYEYNPDDPTPGDRAYRIKARHRARGTGRVFRRHSSPGLQVRAVLRPLGAAVLSTAHWRWSHADWHFQRFVGRLEGLTGRVLPGPRP